MYFCIYVCIHVSRQLRNCASSSNGRCFNVLHPGGGGLPEKHALSWRKALFLGPHDDLRILSHARPIAPANPTSSVCCDVRVATTMSTGLTSSSCGTLCSTISLHTSNVMDSMIMTLSRMNGLQRWEWNQKNQHQRIPSRVSCPLSICALHARLLTTGMCSGRHTFQFPWLLRRTTSICPGLSPASFLSWGCVENEVMRHMCRTWEGGLTKDSSRLPPHRHGAME
jgi:hypothetical protein